MGVRSALKGLVVVLPYFISVLGVLMDLSVTYNFTAQKTCSPQGVPEDVNSFICNSKDLDLVNDITTMTSALRSTCSAVSSSIFGFIRDLTGKSKPLMLIGVIAELINVSTYFTTTLYWSCSPWIHSLVYAFVSGGFGDNIMQLGATCLLIQTSAPEELPLRHNNDDIGSQIHMLGSFVIHFRFHQGSHGKEQTLDADWSHRRTNKYITTMTSALRSTCSAVSSSIFGFIRDLTGKSKPLMLIGVIAELINVSTYFTTTLYWSCSPWIHSLVYAFVSGGFGDNIMQLGATCLLIQTSAPEELPLRMHIFMNALPVFVVVGGAVATVIITSLGYQWLFTLVMTLQAISLILVIALVKEKEAVTKSFKDSLGILKNLFKWRDNVIVLWLMLFAGPIMLSTITVEATNTSSFLQMKFHFSMYQITSYGSYNITIAIVGSIIASAILRKVFHCSELMTGIISSIVNIVGSIVLAYIETPFGLYLCTILNFMRLVTFPLPNTIIGKIVSHEELGTYLGFAAVITSWVPLTITKLFRIVFQNTTTTDDRWEGAFYLVSAGIFGVLAIIYSFSYFFYDESKTIQAMSKSQEKIDQNIEKGESSLPEKTYISS